MAAFYYDEIEIRKKTSGTSHTFKAKSNKGATNSKNAIKDVVSDQVVYTIPAGAKSTDEIVFPEIEIDFTTYDDGQRFGLTNVYPEFNDIRDFKGEFILKDTKYPPPHSSHAQPPFLWFMESKSFQKILAPEKVLVGVFDFESIILTRVLDKTYTANITLKDISGTPKYVFSSIEEIYDYHNRKTSIVLGVKESTSPATTINFNDTSKFFCLGGDLGPVCIIIFDETAKPSAQINWKNVDKKNGVLYFD